VWVIRDLAVVIIVLVVCSCGSGSPLNPPAPGPSDAGNTNEVPADTHDQQISGPDSGFDWDALGGAAVESGSCTFIDYSDPGWAIQGTYPDTGMPYDGPAHIVASLVNGLELSLPGAMTSSSGDPPYVYLSGTPAPQLPVDVDVWLTLTYEGQPKSDPCAPFPATPGSCPVAIGWALSVSDHQNGTVLFGETLENPK
jgi:hypothetical protein